MLPPWLDPPELRIGLGCTRLSTDSVISPEQAAATIAAAAGAGVTVFDTAHAYGRDPSDYGGNERLLAGALRGCGAQRTARIVSKGGMKRIGARWVPDGRAGTIQADCEQSLAALGGIEIDTYLVHAPDPRTPWRTTVRALARLAEDGLVRRIGVANINRGQLEEALDIADIAVVQVALSPFDDSALRGGLVEFCERRGIAVMAHSPLGGPRRAAGVGRHRAIARVASAREASPAQVALAWLLQTSPVVVPIPGARRPENARSAARAAALRLRPGDLSGLARELGDTAEPPPARRRAGRVGEVVMVMGIPGAGKSRVAMEFVGKGYQRLNRDELGGTLPALAATLDRRLAQGARRVVLDNTYLTRAARSRVIRAAAGHGLQARCVWVDTPLAQAQVNLVERLLDRFGALPSPEEVRQVARREPGLLLPTSQMRALRELEEPSADEGFAIVERRAFVRAVAVEATREGMFVAAPALPRPGWELAIDAGAAGSPQLVFDWCPGSGPEAVGDAVARLLGHVTAIVESAVCPHDAGPPTCWCRPPLPGLLLDFARRHGVDPARSILIGTGPAHRALATTLGARYLPLAQGAG
jgi:aryl-alcohol dehydrogenase-like predicted oxidoreductase